MLLQDREINKTNLLKVKQNIKKHTKIMAVTKTMSVNAINSAIKNKIYYIGENKIQETEKKIKNFKKRDKIKLHLIGHLQRNKAKKAVLLYDTIETVDSEKILQKINKEAEKIQKIQKIFLQINIGGDKNKFGLTEKEAYFLSKKNIKTKNILIAGIMTILPNNIKKQTQEKLYKKMKKIQQKLYTTTSKECTELSMGMSQDYKTASLCGSTQIRIGTCLYGER